MAAATNRPKTKQRISYVIPLTDSSHGHRLGVDGLAIDRERSILYSGGRDGAICSWNLDDNSEPGQSPRSQRPAVTARSQIQAHTHWVNDIALVQNSDAVVSASSDCSVKIWRPHSEEARIPSTVGLHTDYVKCLSSPGPGVDWIASGGYDKTIRIWDLNANRQKLEIDATEGDKTNKKGSIYALKIAGGIMASGAPDGIVRVWDYRSGRRITRLTGHTGPLRAILINDLGDTVMSASSDQSIKLWSLKTGRCMHTLTMHNESVWRLWSDDPDLATFYSADRSGLIIKTDTRYRASLDEALSVAVGKENEMITNMIVAGNRIWTSTPNSSINGWRNVKTDLNQPKVSTTHARHESLASRPRGISDVGAPSFGPLVPDNIPAESVIATTAVARAEAAASKFKDLEGFNPSFADARKLSVVQLNLEEEEDEAKPVNLKPDETIEGQTGLRQYALLNDRRRVLTVDTSGSIMLWDLITCQPIHNYGKQQNFEKLADELNTEESIPVWCSIDVATGRLAITLKESDAFDAEVYGDELGLGDQVVFNEQQRVIYGKWILRHLFAGLVDEEIKRDEEYRLTLGSKQSGPAAESRLVPVPETTVTGADDDGISAISSQPVNGTSALSPGLGIGVATPGVLPTSPGAAGQSPLLTAKASGADLARNVSRTSDDYFTRSVDASSAPADSQAKDTEQPTGTADGPQSPGEEKEAKSSFFSSKSFKMKFPKKLGRSASEATKQDEDKNDEEAKDLEENAPVFDDSLFGTIQAIRHEYDASAPDRTPTGTISSGIAIIPIEEAPPLELPGHVTVVIQEEKTDTGGVIEIYRGTVSSLGKDVDVLEKLAPQWLGDLLFRGLMPTKDPLRLTKQAFCLLPLDDELPQLPTDQDSAPPPSGSTQPARLTAPRILRAKKMIEYVAERLNPASRPIASDGGPPPEEYLEIYCSNRFVPPRMTLQTIRALIWRSSNDIVLHYKSNGKWPAFDAYYKARLENGKAQKATEAGSDQA